MKITLICIGKTDDQHIVKGIEIYTKRLKHYVNFQIVAIPDIKNSKNLSESQQKEKEAEKSGEENGKEEPTFTDHVQ